MVGTGLLEGSMVGVGILGVFLGLFFSSSLVVAAGEVGDLWSFLKFYVCSEEGGGHKLSSGFSIPRWWCRERRLVSCWGGREGCPFFNERVVVSLNDPSRPSPSRISSFTLSWVTPASLWGGGRFLRRSAAAERARCGGGRRVLRWGIVSTLLMELIDSGGIN